jgi:hypothetical protein
VRARERGGIYSKVEDEWAVIFCMQFYHHFIVFLAVARDSWTLAFSFCCTFDFSLFVLVGSQNHQGLIIYQILQLNATMKLIIWSCIS